MKYPEANTCLFTTPVKYRDVTAAFNWIRFVVRNLGARKILVHLDGSERAAQLHEDVASAGWIGVESIRLFRRGPSVLVLIRCSGA
jgi:predicted 2-oxoglutarate/Fe(II)-dependent dioxygenase YbiX